MKKLKNSTKLLKMMVFRLARLLEPWRALGCPSYRLTLHEGSQLTDDRTERPVYGDPPSEVSPRTETSHDEVRQSQVHHVHVSGGPHLTVKGYHHDHNQVT